MVRQRHARCASTMTTRLLVAGTFLAPLFERRDFGLFKGRLGIVPQARSGRVGMRKEMVDPGS